MTPFHLIDPDATSTAAPERKQLLAERSSASHLSHEELAPKFRPGDDLVAAINVALRLGAPLLLTGEPGTGKTQVAYYFAWYFGLERPLRLDVRSTTTYQDLLYHFDTVAYFHAAYEQKQSGSGPIDKGKFVEKRPLWEALESREPSVLLIDEIDKAPRDFPNDLLAVLAEMRFTVKETGEEVPKTPPASPPFVVITSNSERKLPEPFLRRCIFHHIRFDDALIRTALAAHFSADAVPDKLRDAAIEQFWKIRDKVSRKKPATAELIQWLHELAGLGVKHEALRQTELKKLPSLSVLVKDRDDFDALG